MKISKPVAILVSLAVAAVALADPSWVEFESSAEGQAPQLTVLESSFAGTTINLKTFGMWVEDVEEDGMTYQRITLPASHTGQVGKPMLPVVNRLVAIPPTAGVKVIVESKNEIVLEDYLVYPAQPPKPEGEPEEEFQKDEEFYEQDTLYPVKLSEVGPPGIMNDVRLVHLSIQPFRYNPKTKELIVATDLTIHLDYSGVDDCNQLKRRPMYFDPQWERLYRALVLNFDDIYGLARISDVVLPVQHYILYLIIYAYDFRPGLPENQKLQEFIEWKTRKGCYVDAVDLNSIQGIDGQPDDVEDVKAYIYGWWYNDGLIYPGPVSRYVLLVGDAPVENITYPEPYWEHYEPVQCADDGHVPTYFWVIGHMCGDYYYSLMSDDDYPDLTVGRWCPRNSDDLEAYVNKISDYEKEIDPTWQPGRALFACDQDEGLDDLKDDIIDIIHSNPEYSQYPVITQYGNDDETWNYTVINYLNAGRGILNYRGHGLPEHWGTGTIGDQGWNNHREIFETADIRSLTNLGRYPAVFQLASSLGRIIYTEEGAYPDEVESTVEAWTRHPTGGGVAAFGCSTSSLGSDYLDIKIFDGLFTKHLNTGMAINYAKSSAITELQTNDVGLKAAHMYYWIGDPELDVWRGQPQEAYVEYNAVCNPPDPYLVVTVYLNDGHQTPVEGAQVCIHKDGEYHAVTYTISSGEAYLPLPPSGSSVVVTNQKGPNCIIPIMDVFYLEGGYSMDIEESVEVVDWQLKPVYPNPLHSRATISYSVAGKLGSKETQFVEISVFDVSGREVKTLVSETKNPGYYEVIWNGKDNKGLRCSSGVYFIRMHSAEFTANDRLVLLR